MSTAKRRRRKQIRFCAVITQRNVADNEIGGQKGRMFSTIRDKLLNVTKTVPLFSSNSDKSQVQCAVNLNAGSDILTRYQNEWEVIHSTNEENAKKAEEAADLIAKVTTKIQRDKESLGVMTHLLSNSNLMLNISNCTKQIEQLYRGFSEVEEGLLQLEDLIDTVEFESMKKQHRYHLQQYKARKEGIGVVTL